MRDQANHPQVRPAFGIVATATDPLLNSGIPHRWYDGTTLWEVDAAGAATPVPAGGSPVSLQTTNATKTRIGAAIAIADGACVAVEAWITALKSDKTQGAAYRIQASFRRNGATVSQLGPIGEDDDQIDYIREDDATWGGPLIEISGTTVEVRVTGKAATTINWKAETTVYGS